MNQNKLPSLLSSLRHIRARNIEDFFYVFQFSQFRKIFVRLRLKQRKLNKERTTWRKRHKIEWHYLKLVLCLEGEKLVSLITTKSSRRNLIRNSHSLDVAFIARTLRDDEWLSQTQVNDTERCGWKSVENRAMYFLCQFFSGFLGKVVGKIQKVRH